MRSEHPWLVAVALIAIALLVGPAAGPAAGQPADPRWRFYTKDRTPYSSPWYAGAHRKMIPYGCTRAPYYEPDPRCPHGHGFHHGLDIAIPCGVKVYAGRMGWIADSSGLGPAYGSRALVLRNHRLGVDMIIGHVQRVFVSRGDRVTRGQLIAEIGDDAAPDGCHLHFEVRAAGAGLASTRRPTPYLDLVGEAD